MGRGITIKHKNIFIMESENYSEFQQRTKEDIFKEMREAMPYKIIGEQELKPYILEAMQIYADQEARNYARWLSNQVIQGGTAGKLFNDYKKHLIK